MADPNGKPRPLIVIPAYRRPEALGRLLESLNRAVYPEEGAELIISIDGGAHSRIHEMADSFRFAGGRHRVIEQERRLKVHDHILRCGDFTEEHGSVIVLEEDLMVAPDFYRYASAALSHYEDCQAVGGIALYAYEFNEFARLPFVPLADRYDAYFMAVACSSGQAWTRSQWRAFRQWLETAGTVSPAANTGLPKVLKRWPDSSWKKYYGAWLAETGRYMVYPRFSLTTNCSDSGGIHIPQETPDHQVAMALESAGDRIAPRFPPALDDPAGHPVCYDAFMEPCGSYIRSLAGTGDSRLEVDLNGIKPVKHLSQADWCITIKPTRRPERSYPLSFRPVEHNMAHPCGNDGAVFNLTRPGDIIRHTPKRSSRYRLIRYYVRGVLDRFDFLSGYPPAFLRRLGNLWLRWWTGEGYR